MLAVNPLRELEPERKLYEYLTGYLDSHTQGDYRWDEKGGRYYYSVVTLESVAV